MKKFLTTLISILIGILIGSLVLKIIGISPLEAYQVMWEGAFGKTSYISYIIIRSAPLILTGLSVAFAFQTGLFNIGAEGQYMVGALAAAFLGLKLNFHPLVQIPTIILLSMMISGCWGAIAGIFKSRFGVHEVISTIMLNWIAFYLQNYFVMLEGFRRPDTETTEFILPQSSITFFEDWKVSDMGMQYLEQHSFLKDFMRPPVNASIFFAIIACLIIYYVLKKTTFGFSLRATGLSFEAAEYAGINVKRKMTQSMFIAGALSGLAGATQVMGVSKNIAILAAMEGHGFDGIAVSLIGANSPLGVLFSGFFFGALQYSGSKLQSKLEAPSEIIAIMMGIIVLIVAIPMTFKFIKKRGQHA